MGQLIEMTNTATMSSLEIADLTGKRHDHVLRDARAMLEEIQSPQSWGDYQDGRGRSQPCLMLNKEESLCLVTGYSAKLRMAVIKRWQELEEGRQVAVQSIGRLDFVNKICETDVYSKYEKREMIRKVAKDLGFDKYLPKSAPPQPRVHVVNHSMTFEQAVAEFVGTLSGAGCMPTEDAYRLFCEMYGTNMARRNKFVSAVRQSGVEKSSYRFDGISRQGFKFIH